ncbi:carboxy-terminal processing protease precursor [unidentified eubacterium SCB49]|nr:carboxy-terminal processing protease precursor [unidentified eubacterium SCB49]
MKFKREYIPLLIGLAMAGGIYLGSKLNFNDTGEQLFATNSKKDKLNRLIDYIDYEYVDDINTDSIVDVTVNEILENLDPHSVYIPESEYEDTADDMRGNFTGIGVSFHVYKDTIAVIRAIEGGPAVKAGVKEGDRILKADDRELFGNAMSRDSIPEYLKGEKGSKVTLQIYRPSEDQVIDLTLRRDDVPLISVDAAYAINDEIGYIKLNRFAETSYDEFKVALHELNDKEIATLILDLRGNPGGYIATAEKILDEFLEDDTLLLITKNKKGEEDKTYATGRGDFEGHKVYVLIDENSASASEIVAGALQDNDKGIIVGRRSFGKGLVQREMSLGDGSAVRLTIARYYTPSGRSIQRSYEEGNEAYFKEYETRYHNGELLDADNIVVSDSLVYKTVKGRTVYGGGGITPDIFVPKDTTREHETIDFISRSGSMSFYVFTLIDKNRKELNALSFEDFSKTFNPTTEDVQGYIDYIWDLSSVRLNLEASSSELKLALKAAVAEQLFGPEEKEILNNLQDPMILKVLEIEEKNKE